MHIINLACYGKRPNGGVAQLARASGSYPAGRRFKSHRRYHLARWSRGQDTALSRRNHGFDSRTGHQQRDVSNDVPNYFGDLAQLVRAFASHARGHGFESPSLHQKNPQPFGCGFSFTYSLHEALEVSSRAGESAADHQRYDLSSRDIALPTHKGAP